MNPWTSRWFPKQKITCQETIEASRPSVHLLTEIPLWTQLHWVFSGVSWRSIFAIIVITHLMPSEKSAASPAFSLAEHISALGTVHVPMDGCLSHWSGHLRLLRYKSVSSALQNTKSHRGIRRLLFEFWIRRLSLLNLVMSFKTSPSVFTQKLIPLEQLFVVYIGNVSTRGIRNSFFWVCKTVCTKLVAHKWLGGMAIAYHSRMVPKLLTHIQVC